MFTHREGKNGFAFLFVCNVFERKIVINCNNSTLPRGSRNISFDLLKKKDIRPHLRTVKVSQTSIPTEKDLILANTGKFNEDGTNMTICPRHRAEHGMFGDRVENVRTLGSDIRDEQRNHVKVEQTFCSQSR